MKNSDLKVIAIIVTIALFFTIVTSNAVSIASVVLLATGGISSTGDATGGTTTGGTTTGGTTTGGTTTGGTTTGGTTTGTTTGGTTTGTTTGGTTTGTTTGGGTTPATPSGDNGSKQDQPAAPSGDNNNDAPAAGPTAEEVFNEYKSAAHEVKTKGNCSYNKKEWQVLENLQVGSVGGILQPIIDSYMTTEAEAEVQATEKGEKSMSRFPDCTLSDMSKVASATKEGNVITIIMADEDTPRNAESSFLAQVTNSILFWDDIEKELQGISVIKGYDGAHVVYAGYKIIAEIENGQFKSLRHEAVANISCPDAKITVFSLPLSGTLYNYCVYSDFAY